jgi:riboflavin kinase / FMN adenylyltransferase
VLFLDKIYNGYKHCDANIQGATLVIGKFDGIHLGHQEIIRQAKQYASKNDSFVAVYTFTPHPYLVLHPQKPFKAIFTEKVNFDRLEYLGIKTIINEPFNQSFMNISAEDFIQKILIETLNVKCVLVGENFRFGHQSKGDINLLKQILEDANKDLIVVKPIIYNNQICSSGLIRSLLTENNKAHVDALLKLY